MVKADSTWPRPLHVAWQSPYFHGSSTVPEPRLCDLPAHLNASTCISPGHNAFTFPAFTNLGTKQADGLQGSLQYPNHHQTGDIQDIRAVSELCLKETYCGGDMRNENPASLQKKFLIFDQSGNKTRLLYHPVFPFPQIPFVAPTKFTQPSNEIEEGQATNKGENDPIKCSLPNESDENHVINEESEMHEDTDEINALLYSDEDGDDDYIDDDEVASTGCSPLARKRTYLMQEQFENIKEEVASSDQPNKKRKLIDDKYKRSSPINSSSSVRLNETCEYISDAESKYSSGQTYFAKQPEGEDNSIVGDIQLKKDKIRESLRVLENLVPGAKGKQPLLVIDETIEYLKSFMSQTGTLGLKDI